VGISGRQTGQLYLQKIGVKYMQARYYDPVIGRFYSNYPVDALGHMSTPNGIQGFNRYTYANNNPYKFVDPDGRATAYFWYRKTSGYGQSAAGHVSVMTDDGVYISHFPDKNNGWLSTFHTLEEDISNYGRIDAIVRIDLPNEKLATEKALDIFNEKFEKVAWGADGHCATTSASVLGAGGFENLSGSLLMSPAGLEKEIMSKGASQGIKTYRVSGRIESRKLDKGED
jgi:RHS repeat-associated protein